MTREEAIAFFKDMNECTYGNLEAVEMAIEALSSSEKPNKWIPIKTRPLTAEEKEHYADLGYSEDSIEFMYDCDLPEDGQVVLITDRLGNVEVDTFCRDDGCYFEDNCGEDDVVAWMPFPTPYEPQESEGKE